MLLKTASDGVLLGRTCLFCNKRGLYKLGDKRVKCSHCRAYYSLTKLRKDARILYFFYLELSARKAARELRLNYKSVHRQYMSYRARIAEHLDKEFTKLGGKLEMDESYFGGKRKGKRGRGAANKAIVFGILERHGKVYTAVVPNVKAMTLMGEIRSKAVKGSVFYTDCFKSYKSLKQYGKHSRINHSKVFGKGHNHINGIEGFWSYAKERFHKYHGINRQNYPLYLKEMEFRFNHRNDDVFKLLVDIIMRRIGAETT